MLYFFFFSGPHPGGAEQVGPDRRRDLGQDHLHGEEQEGGQSVRAHARAHRQRIGGRIRRIQVRTHCTLFTIAK